LDRFALFAVGAARFVMTEAFFAVCLRSVWAERDDCSDLLVSAALFWARAFRRSARLVGSLTGALIAELRPKELMAPIRAHTTTNFTFITYRLGSFFMGLCWSWGQQSRLNYDPA
jgi:hypothetical protein